MLDCSKGKGAKQTICIRFSSQSIKMLFMAFRPRDNFEKKFDQNLIKNKKQG